MIRTEIFTATALAHAKIKDIRTRLGSKTPACQVVRDDQNGAALAYATRLAELGAKAGVNVIQMSYAEVDTLTKDGANDPVIFLHPAPTNIDVYALIDTLGPARDAEGLHSINAGELALQTHKIAPPTAQAAYLVAEQLVGPLSGKKVAIVGASHIVGLPLALLMIHAGATVRIAQASTLDLVGETRDADVVISAAGVPGLITAEHIAAGACVIDVGVTRVSGKLCGDVDQMSVHGKAAIITHVPDGVGPLTAACLFENVLTLTEQSNR